MHTRGASPTPRVEPPVSPGEIVAGKYRIEQTIGSGGMGVVVAATHLQLGQPVALKFVRAQQTGTNERVLGERFLREARALFRLRSEHAVRVLDVGTLPTGVPFMVMELLQGKDLKDVLLEKGPLPEAEAIEYILQACTALQEAHAYGIVHRDLKPRNLYLTTRVDGSPCVKVLDFGISKVPKEDKGADSEGPLTSPEIALGSPRYMAPEQWKASSAVDARADVYALGMILYELLTGELPLRDLPLGELLRRIVAGAIPGPREVRPSISENMNKVVLKALRPHAEERYQSVQQLSDALRSIRAGAPSMRPRMPSNPLSSTANTAVVARPQLQVAASQAVPTPQDRLPTGSEPPTRREVPAKPAPDDGSASEITLKPDDVDIPFDEPQTLVSSQPKPPARAVHAATLQSSTVPPEVEAALARAQAAPKVEEVRFDDKTTVDPPQNLNTTVPLAMQAQGPISGSGVSPAAQSVVAAPAPPTSQPQLQTMPLPAPPGALGPPPTSGPYSSPLSRPMQPPIQVVQAGITTLPTARKRGMPTWLWVVIVLVLGFALGGGLALAFALKAV